MPADEWTYVALYERGAHQPWMLLRHQSDQLRSLGRWIPHLHEWVEVTSDYMDFLSGHSSTSLENEKRTITAEEAAAFYSVVIDLSDEVVDESRVMH